MKKIDDAASREREMNVPERAIYVADNLDVLREIKGESFDLIYVDAPYDSKKMPPRDAATQSTFNETWTWSDVSADQIETLENEQAELWRIIKAAKAEQGDAMAAWLVFLSIRLVEMYRTLKASGCLFLHCGHSSSHHLKQVLTALSGGTHWFQHIVWQYGGESESEEDYFLLPHPSQDMANAVESRDPKAFWEIPGIVPHSEEDAGYGTQKPVDLLERVIQYASQKSGLRLLDPFVGTGTACIAAENLKWNWVAIDSDEEGVVKTCQRLSSRPIPVDVVPETRPPN